MLGPDREGQMAKAHEDARKGNVTKVERHLRGGILWRGIDPNVKDARGATPLHWAGSIEVAKVLIAAGALVDAKDTSGRSPLHWMAGVREFQPSWRSREKCFLQPDPEIVRLLVEQGADLNAQDTNGQTPLHVAAAVSSEVVALLLTGGACVDAKDENGNTPLHVAAKHHYPTAVRLLIDNKADVNATSRWGSTPLSLFAKSMDLMQCKAVKGFLVPARGAGHPGPDAESGVAEPGPVTRCTETLELLVQAGAVTGSDDPLLEVVEQSTASLEAHDDEAMFPDGVDPGVGYDRGSYSRYS
jgi:hypothetical protein